MEKMRRFQLDKPRELILELRHLLHAHILATGEAYTKC